MIYTALSTIPPLSKIAQHLTIPGILPTGRPKQCYLFGAYPNLNLNPIMILNVRLQTCTCSLTRGLQCAYTQAWNMPSFRRSDFA